MPPRPLIETVKLSIAVPRGEEGFWSIICRLDDRGSWTVRQVADHTNVAITQVARYVRKLRLGGFAEPIAEQINGRNGRNIPSAIVYRLAKKPFDAPRLRPDGTELPEPAAEQLWRAMKMAKSFGATDLAEVCPGVTKSAARNYCYQLAAAGVLSQNGHVFRLVNNLGPRAPRILRTKFVFDPNSREVIGSSVTFEVKS